MSGLVTIFEAVIIIFISRVIFKAFLDYCTKHRITAYDFVRNIVVNCIGWTLTVINLCLLVAFPIFCIYVGAMKPPGWTGMNFFYTMFGIVAVMHVNKLILDKIGWGDN